MSRETGASRMPAAVWVKPVCLFLFFQPFRFLLIQAANAAPWQLNA
jgi:hypothetical protein